MNEKPNHIALYDQNNPQMRLSAILFMDILEVM
jgi:hypothetical protein